MKSGETTRCDEVIGVVGLGALGRGIVACCLSRGFAVVGIDREQSNRELLSDHLPEAAAQCVEAGVIDPNDPADWEACLELSGDLTSIGRACLVIEAIPEHLPSKKQLLQEIEGIVPADLPIGSNTSAFPITVMQEGCKHPDRIFGMHWSSHGHVTRFMELTPGEQTSPETMAFAAAMAARLGKEPAILKKDIPGFLCNRIAYAMYREAVYLLESGVADAASIDRSFRNSVGLWAAMCGPLRVIDVMGGGAFYAESIEGVLPTLASSTELQATLQSFIDRNAKGPKNDIGFFRYKEINAFAKFALQQLDHGGTEISMDELYDMWRRENPDPAAYAENVAAVQGAIDDFKKGDRGQPAGEVSRELRENLGATSGE